MKTDAKLTPFQQALLDSVSKDYAHIPSNDALKDPFSEGFKAWAKLSNFGACFHILSFKKYLRY